MEKSDPQIPNHTGDPFDRERAKFEGLPDVIITRPATIEVVPFLVGQTETHIVQTIKHGDGETILLQVISSSRALRLVIPPKVAAVIYRQREAASSQLRSRLASKAAEDRKTRGLAPAFMKNPARGGRKAAKKAKK